MDLETTQIIKLAKENYSAEEIALALGKHPALVDIAIKSHLRARGKQSFEERYGKDLQDLVVATYKDVMENSENDSARVRAAELLDTKIENSGAQGFDYSQLANALKELNQSIEINDEDKKLLLV